MIRRFVAPVVILAGLLAGPVAVEVTRAAAEELRTGTAPVDAGAPVATPEPAAPAAAPVIADPVADPSGYAHDVTEAFKAGQWAFLVVLALFGLSRALLWAAAKWSIAWLKRATPSLVALSVGLASVGASLSAGGSVDIRATMGALAMAVALYLSPVPQPKAVG